MSSESKNDRPATPFARTVVPASSNDLRLYGEAKQLRSEALARMVPAFARLVRRHAWAPVVRWYKRRQMRADLMQLDDRILADIGLSRSDIDRRVAEAYGPVPSPVADGGAVLPLNANASRVRPRPAHEDRHPPLAA